ncbi:MAG: bifunctional precorrin-2 dehydrogenase/sirohydrochlorin ferrochelatase [Chloroflexi bacterium]|nr:bifunctional precorrin-2 dehydrogenase/sirohydrochlorin ferrochelatase [Chloroflexota bacterium]
MIGYPITLVHLHRARCLVVGGGKVAARKVVGLITTDAQVVVISPVLCERLELLAECGDIEVMRRDYCSGDLEETFLVIAATDDPAVNHQIWEEAQEQGVLINVVDDPPHCTFIAPAVVRQGPLTLAISTGGRCPALARHLREQFEQEFDPTYGRFVELLGELRERTVTALPFSRRNAFWEQLFHSDVLALIRSGDEATARRRAEKILAQHLEIVQE